MKTQTLLVIGAGRMGGALIDGWKARGHRLLVVDTQQAKMQDVEQYQRLVDCPVLPEVAVVVVKPYQTLNVLAELAATWPGKGFPVISMAAGVTLDAMQQALGASRALVRAMPNLPAMVGEGVFGAIGHGLYDGSRQMVSVLLEQLGPVVWLQQESQMDALTALSGSGPAYLFHLIECLQAGGEALGLSAADAELLALQTIKGAAIMAAESPEKAGTLRERVTSPGGTTQAALDVFMRPPGLRGMVAEAMQAAADRSRQMASES